MTSNEFREDFYEQFGIAKFSTADEVKKAYRVMALKHHPDRGGNTQMMQNVNAINEVLTKQKDDYDFWLRQRIGVRAQPGPTVRPTYTGPFTTGKTARSDSWQFFAREYADRFNHDEFMAEFIRRMAEEMKGF